MVRSAVAFALPELNATLAEMQALGLGGGGGGLGARGGWGRGGGGGGVPRTPRVHFGFQEPYIAAIPCKNEVGFRGSC